MNIFTQDYDVVVHIQYKNINVGCKVDTTTFNEERYTESPILQRDSGGKGTRGGHGIAAILQTEESPPEQKQLLQPSSDMGS